jgi:hypothetical protein
MARYTYLMLRVALGGESGTPLRGVLEELESGATQHFTGQTELVEAVTRARDAMTGTIGQPTHPEEESP